MFTGLYNIYIGNLTLIILWNWVGSWTGETLHSFTKNEIPVTGLSFRISNVSVSPKSEELFVDGTKLPSPSSWRYWILNAKFPVAEPPVAVWWFKFSPWTLFEIEVSTWLGKLQKKLKSWLGPVTIGLARLLIENVFSKIMWPFSVFWVVPHAFRGNSAVKKVPFSDISHESSAIWSSSPVSIECF